VEDDEIDRLLREAGLELPDVADNGEDETLPRWNDDEDLEGWG
jgi:hypothetical protein